MKIRPATPNLDEVMREFSELLKWWFNDSWWNVFWTAVVIFLVLWLYFSFLFVLDEVHNLKRSGRSK